MIYIAESNGFITDLSFSPVLEATHVETGLLTQAKSELSEYFDKKRKTFDLPIALRGTAFQMSAWRVLQEIPYGKTISYKEQAALAGNAKAVRAIGNANGKNPISIIVPCHRVIGTSGSLTGYGGGIENKRYLLELERSS